MNKTRFAITKKGLKRNAKAEKSTNRINDKKGKQEKQPRLVLPMEKQRNSRGNEGVAGKQKWRPTHRGREKEKEKGKGKEGENAWYL